MGMLVFQFSFFIFDTHTHIYNALWSCSTSSQALFHLLSLPPMPFFSPSPLSPLTDYPLLSLLFSWPHSGSYSSHVLTVTMIMSHPGHSARPHPFSRGPFHSLFCISWALEELMSMSWGPALSYCLFSGLWPVVSPDFDHFPLLVSAQAECCVHLWKSAF